MLTLKIDQRKLKAAIKRKAAPAVQNLADDLLEALVDATPMQTGRTVASWNATTGAPVAIDAGEVVPPTPGTNEMPIGAEPGRSEAEAIAMQHRAKISPKDPFAPVYVTNGAALDSERESSLPQGPGSRAYMMDIGEIPDADAGFDPRGLGMSIVAISKFINKHRE